jgi:hypothetical protein
MVAMMRGVDGGMKRQITTSHAPRIMRGGDSHAHHPPAPPSFVQLPVPNRPLPEEYELLWDDPVAPELALDFDAQHIPLPIGVLMFSSGLAFFALVGAFVYFIIDAPSQNPAAKRELPYNNLEKELGGYDAKKKKKLAEE